MSSDEKIQEASPKAEAENRLANLRFSKFIRFDGDPDTPTPTFPLSKLGLPEIKSLRVQTKADAIVIPDGKVDEEKINNNSEKPIYPGEDRFWREFETVLDFRIAREFKFNEKLNSEDENDVKLEILQSALSANNKWAWPNEWKDLSLEQIAQEVNGEYPASIQAEVVKKVYSSKEAKMENFILDLGQYEGNRSRSSRDFIGLQVLMADINTWTFRAVARENFMLKWHYGMPRPEEIAWLIQKDSITTKEHGVPKKIVKLVKYLELNGPFDFTAYKKTGCPTHPSFPAMHSAGSTLSTWLPALFNISPEQYREALLIDHGVAMGRTVAGVHYVQDNLAGLNIGQRIIRKELPEYMEVNFKYDLTKVEKRLGDLAFKNRLDDLAFDWNDFDSKVCKNNVTECPIVRKYVDLYNKSNQVDFVFSTEQQTSEE